jgi:hypothetical protein
VRVDKNSLLMKFFYGLSRYLDGKENYGQQEEFFHAGSFVM